MVEESVDEGNAVAINRLAAERAGNLFENHGLCCSEAVLVTLNQGFNGELSSKNALQIGAGFCHGMGGSGCTCGALAASVSALGLFLSPHNAKGFSKKEFHRIIQQMHDRFKEEFKSTCCRVLTKNVKHDRKAQKANCLKLTRGAVYIAAELLTAARPEITGQIDAGFLRSTEKV